MHHWNNSTETDLEVGRGKVLSLVFNANGLWALADLDFVILKL